MTSRAAAAILFVLPLLAQDWPQLLGPNRNGVYNGPFNPQTKLQQVWKKSIGDGFSPPVVAGGRLIVFHRKGGQEIVESLDAATGASQWTYAYATSYRDDFGFSEGPRAAAAVDGDRVYTYGADSMLTCVDLKTGAKVWAIDAKKDFGVRKEFFGAAVSPLIDGGRLLMNIGGSKGAGIIALDKSTGKVAWQALTTEAGYSSPIVATIAGERHALFFTREGLVDTDPESGRIRYQLRWRSRQAASVNAATPIVSGNQVFLSASYETGAVLLDVNATSAKPVWSSDEALSNHYANSVLKDGFLYGFHGRQEFGQEFRCVEWKTGKVRWNVEGFGAGSVTLAGNHLIILREDGNLVIAPASPEKFAPVNKAKVSSSLVRSYPALANGRIYVRSTTNELACYRLE